MASILPTSTVVISRSAWLKLYKDLQRSSAKVCLYQLVSVLLLDTLTNHPDMYTTFVVVVDYRQKGIVYLVIFRYHIIVIEHLQSDVFENILIIHDRKLIRFD
jgi:hypothetical protein